MSNNTDKPECAIEPARSTSPYSREALRSVREVNEFFLGWLVRSDGLTEIEGTIQRQLVGMSAESLRLAADVPFLLVDARFQDARAWRQVAEESGGRELLNEVRDLPRASSRVGLARSTFFAAWYIVHRWPSSAELLIGATQDVIASISRVELTQLAEVSESRTSWIAPRWPDRPDVWEQLLAAATTASHARSASIRQRALQLLLGRLLG